MAMYSRVPVIPLIKDYNVLTIKTKTFRVALTGERFESFDQDIIDGSLISMVPGNRVPKYQSTGVVCK